MRLMRAQAKMIDTSETGESRSFYTAMKLQDATKINTLWQTLPDIEDIFIEH